jgi:tail tube protein gp19
VAQFTVNAHRIDPYKNFKFRVKWDGRLVAGVSKISGLKRTTEVIEHREGGDPSKGGNATPRWSSPSRQRRPARREGGPQNDRRRSLSSRAAS